MCDLNLGHPFASIYQNGKVDFDDGACVRWYESEALRTYFAGRLNLNSLVFFSGEIWRFIAFRPSDK